MIEITKVEPKKIQRKLLTEVQKKAICKKHTNCHDCPMLLMIANEQYCYENISYIEKEIRDYWNEEIEVSE